MTKFIEIETDVIIYLHDDQGMSFGDIAAKYGVNKSTISMRYYRAKRKRHNDEAGRVKGVKSDMKGNHGTLNYKGTRIPSDEELMTWAGFDPEKWKPYRAIINKWEVGAKVEKKTLEAKDGVWTGSIESTGELTVEPLFQVKVWVECIEPHPIEPVITPIRINTTYETPEPGQVGPVSSSLILTDLHVGFKRTSFTLKPLHDRRALWLAVEIAKRINPDRIDILGDALDMTEWTRKFTVSPDYYLTTQPALVELVYWLSQLRSALPAVPITFFDGNHEKRLYDAISNHLPQAYKIRPGGDLKRPELLSLRSMLSLDDLGIEYISNYPDGHRWAGPLRMMHGNLTRQNPGDTTRATAKQYKVSTAVGHSHRAEFSTQVFDGPAGLVPIYSICSACLCHVDGRIPGHTLSQNWSQGVTELRYSEEGFPGISPTFYSIFDGAAVVGDELLEAPGDIDRSIQAWVVEQLSTLEEV